MNSSPKLGYLFAFGAILIWSGFILVSRQGGISPLTAYDVVAIRYTSCAIIMLPIWFFMYRVNLLQARLVVTALIGGLAYGLFAYNGFETSPASHAAILLPGTLPLVIMLIAANFNKERFALLQWLGVSVISLGIFTLFWQELNAQNSVSTGHLALVGAATCWSIFSVLINRWNIKPLEATIALALVTCTVYLPLYLLFLPSKISFAMLEDIALQAFYQGFLVAILQMLFYVRAVQIIGASRMGTLMALVPILAGFSAIPLFNETLTIELVLSLLLVSAGVGLANSAKKRAKPKQKINTSLKFSTTLSKNV